MHWDGAPLLSGTNDKPLQSIGILFYYYPFDGVGGPSFFGTESVDLVRVAETSDDITTTTTSSSSSTAITSCPIYTSPCGSACCKGFEQCCGDFCCSKSGEVCCGNECCQYCAILNVYGDNSEEVALLRKYRDEVLNNTLVGQEIIRLYYLWFSAIVKAMDENEQFKREIQEVIDRILPMIMEEVE